MVHKKLYEWIAGWWSFNPGHEHPDQNSFVFFPNGKPFITEALYGPKFTFLNNVLTFGPSKSAKCYAPYQGQNGDCKKWLVYRDNEVEKTWAELVTATDQGGMVFVSGDATRAYPSKLQLESVYRSLLLLDNQTLLVLDHIALGGESMLQMSNAFFHNIHAPFQLSKGSESKLAPQAFIDHENQRNKVYWISSDRTSLKARTDSLTYQAEFGTRTTNFLNVSISLTGSLTRVAYLFASDKSQITKFSFLEQSDTGVQLTVGIQKSIFNISVVTNYKDAKSRYNWLGFLGYAHVNVSTGLHVRFGLDTVKELVKSEQVNAQPKPKPKSKTNDMDELEWLETHEGNFKAEQIVFKNDFTLHENHELVFIPIGILLFILLLKSKRKTIIKYVVLAVVIFLVMAALEMSKFFRPVAYDQQGPHKRRLLKAVYDLDLRKKDDEFLSMFKQFPKMTVNAIKQQGKLQLIPSLPPKVFITSFLGFGSELISGLFENRSDFFVLSFPTSALQPPPLETRVDHFVDACQWSVGSHNYPMIAGWFKSLFSDPLKHLDPPFTVQLSRNLQKHLVNLKKHRLANPNSQVVLRSVSASWNLKLPWLFDVIGKSLKIIFVIRDPRGWVASMLHKDENRYIKWSIEQRLQEMFNRLPQTCNVGTGYASEHDMLRTYFAAGREKPPPLKVLATLWRANTEAALRIHKDLPSSNYIRVKFEDLLHFPVEIAEKIFQFVGMPLPLSSEHWILQSTRTGLVRLGPEKQLGLATMDWWKKSLTLSQIREIEAVCEPVMQELSYQKYSLN